GGSARALPCRTTALTDQSGAGSAARCAARGLPSGAARGAPLRSRGASLTTRLASGAARRSGAAVAARRRSGAAATLPGLFRPASAEREGKRGSDRGSTEKACFQDARLEASRCWRSRGSILPASARADPSLTQVALPRGVRALEQVERVLRHALRE